MTDYIGLLGFVPFVILFVVVCWYLIKAFVTGKWEDDTLAVCGGILILYIFIFIVAGFLWGITTLGRLL